MLASVRRLVRQRVSLSVPVAAGVALLQLSLVVACALALQQIQAWRELATANLVLAAPPVGRSVPPLVGNDLAGARQIIEYGNERRRPTLVYAFAQDCGPCIANWPALKPFQEMSPERVRIVYVNLVDSLTLDYLRGHGMTEETVLSTIDEASEVHYRVRGTPQAQLISSEGTVVWSKLGKFDESDVARLEVMINTEMQR